MGRYRRWQARHDANLTRRYDLLPQPLRWLALTVYPSQRRQKMRASSDRWRQYLGGDQPPQPRTPPGWYANPHGDGHRWWNGTAWTEHVQL